MNRRAFTTLLGGAAASWPLAARAAGKRPRVAVLTLLSAQDERGQIAAFVGGMQELGYVAGQTFDIDYRYAEGDTERLRPLARELIALAPDVMFAGEPSAARAAKAVAPNLPIVCPVLGDHRSLRQLRAASWQRYRRRSDRRRRECKADRTRE
jgi:putative ABC transport system substrate-binding protein